MCVSVLIPLPFCVWLYVIAIRTYSCDLNSLTGDTNLCSLYTRYIGDSKTDTRDDLEIHTGLCSKDQTAIRIQNRVILCECLLCAISYLPLSIVVCMITCIISCECLAYFISIVVRIISCDISECSFYLYSLFESLFVSFHVLLFATFDLGLVLIYLILDLIL